ncbi:hypothetical protein V2J09_015892 [Rumex salicifolius]
MEVAENKVSEAASNNDRELLDRSFSDRPAEDRERLIRDLKAGLHPLQVEGFWICYCHLVRPSALPVPTDLHLFKEGIRPLWELVALVGDQLDYGDDICGAVLSIRAGEDILSVWNRNASEQPVMALKDSIKRCLKLPQSYTVEYKRHNDSLRDNTSYRNTWLRG